MSSCQEARLLVIDDGVNVAGSRIILSDYAPPALTLTPPYSVLWGRGGWEWAFWVGVNRPSAGSRSRSGRGELVFASSSADYESRCAASRACPVESHPSIATAAATMPAIA